MRSQPNRLLLIVAIIVATSAVHVARAADPGKDKGGGKGNGKPDKEEKVEKPAETPKEAEGSVSNNGNRNQEEKKGKGEKPERPSRDVGDSGSSKGNKNSDADLKSEFKIQADALQKKQKDLINQLKNANSEERGKIRDQLVIIKDNWKELNREYRDKLDDLRDKVERENGGGGRGGRPRK